MNIAIIGYGRMGKEIERLALSRGHTIGLIIDRDNADDLNARKLEGVDSAIEFTAPGHALDNIRRCLESNVPVVSGTTGWLKDIDDAIALTLKSEAAFLYASNFSIGVNIMFQINMKMAELMRGRIEYMPVIEETHHIKKLDAPSGTALSLARGVAEKHDRIKDWKSYMNNTGGRAEEDMDKLPIISHREGDVPGTHEVSWISEADSLSLRHKAKGRQGFAAGAVMAAEYIVGKSGFLTMRDMLGF